MTKPKKSHPWKITLCLQPRSRKSERNLKDIRAIYKKEAQKGMHYFGGNRPKLLMDNESLTND